jgi:hypothetical protein
MPKSLPKIFQLRDAYPTEVHPAGNFDNQCAVRLSICLHKVGIFDKGSFKSWYPSSITKDGWAKSAEELTFWLKIKGLGPYAEYSVNNPPKRDGVAFLRDCHGMNGDHIDVYWYCPGNKSHPYQIESWRRGWCRNDILTGCADGKIRFWPCV